ncbi:unnamed protein product [Schistocephalus solidus]|uniref:Secreted protein n=1 Tax=Schistocephalus solidus TaxID=70667 RepID=A0A183SIS7_SCHSO|nr:unnamed protein product [Schistocephalus solidus]
MASNGILQLSLAHIPMAVLSTFLNEAIICICPIPNSTARVTAQRNDHSPCRRRPATGFGTAAEAPSEITRLDVSTVGSRWDSGERKMRRKFPNSTQFRCAKGIRCLTEPREIKNKRVKL